jgi:putative endonuclease
MVAHDAWIAVYIMTDGYRGTLYIGVTGQFQTRIGQHREGHGGFTKRYGLKRLVWYEIHESMTEAIQRESSLSAIPASGKST